MKALQRAAAGILVAACAGAVVAQGKHPPAHPLELNVANVKELEQVPGIGPPAGPEYRGFSP